MKKLSISVITLFVVLFIAPSLTLAGVDTVCPSGQSLDTITHSYCVQNSATVGSTVGGVNAGAVAPFTNGIIDIINNFLVPLLFAIAFITFLYGVAKTYIFSHGESGEVGEGHKLILWGIIGFVVMVSLWGLVNIVRSTFIFADTGPINDWPKSRN